MSTSLTVSSDHICLTPTQFEVSIDSNSNLNRTNDGINLCSSSIATSISLDTGIFLQRLREQKLKIIEFYDRQIEHGQINERVIGFVDKVDQLLNEISSLIDFDLTKNVNLDENRTLNESLSNYFNDSAAIDVEQMLDDQIKTISKALEENEITNILDNNYVTENDDHSYSKLSRTSNSTKKKSTIIELKRFKYDGCCPLTGKTYGLDPEKHGIRHFPCTRITTPINLYKHLVQYHQLTHSPTMKIVRLLADDKNENDIDLFSCQSNSLIAKHPTVYRAQCPLNQYGKFGITAEHKIRLCTQPNQTIGAPMNVPKDVCLYDHFVVYHQMKRSCAQRLAEAIVKKRSDAIFRPEEELLNDTFYVECPLRNPKSICWKSPISTRHMGQHLTGIHKLDRNQRRQIMASIRRR